MPDSSGCVFISVVRDHSLYDRLVHSNPCNTGGEFVAFDNTVENLPITARYNSFLKEWDYSRKAWFIFLHEDYEFLEPVAPLLAKTDRNAIYGTCGARSTRPGDDVLWALNCNKDGSNLGLYGKPFSKPVEVLTTDCNCLMVHSDLVQKYGLRFDEHLTFDLYAEDFEITAYEKYGISTKVLPVLNRHYSFGHMAERFFKQHQYLMGKYANASRVYGTTTKQLIGPEYLVAYISKKNNFRRKFAWLGRIGGFFLKYKHSKDGYARLRIFGICLKFMAAGRYTRHLAYETGKAKC